MRFGDRRYLAVLLDGLRLPRSETADASARDQIKASLNSTLRPPMSATAGAPAHLKRLVPLVRFGANARAPSILPRRIRKSYSLVVLLQHGPQASRAPPGFSVVPRRSPTPVAMRLSPAVVEVLHKHRRVASHPRSYVPGKHTTNPDHMPSSHRRYAESTPARITQWAAETGPATVAAAETMMRMPSVISTPSLLLDKVQLTDVWPANWRTSQCCGTETAPWIPQAVPRGPTRLNR